MRLLSMREAHRRPASSLLPFSDRQRGRNYPPSLPPKLYPFFPLDPLDLPPSFRRIPLTDT